MSRSTGRPPSEPVASSGSWPRVGFIGLGVMGRPMARNLLRAGVDQVVHSRSPGPVDELVAAGAAEARSPAEVAAAVDVLITVLPDTPDVETVLFGENGAAGALRRGSILIDMSTIDPLATRDFHERLADIGVDMLDAPVSGGERGAIDGTLSIMVGGRPEVFERVRALLDVLGRTVVLVGGPGAGQVTKACNQLVVGTTIEAVAEALVLAMAADVDATRVREVLLAGFAGSKILEVHGQRMLNGEFGPGFRAQLHLKDARIVQRMATALGVPIATFDTVVSALDRLVAEGGGDLDHAALALPVARAAGLEMAGSTPSDSGTRSG